MEVTPDAPLAGVFYALSNPWNPFDRPTVSNKLSPMYLIKDDRPLKIPQVLQNIQITIIHNSDVLSFDIALAMIILKKAGAMIVSDQKSSVGVGVGVELLVNKHTTLKYIQAGDAKTNEYKHENQAYYFGKGFRGLSNCLPFLNEALINSNIKILVEKESAFSIPATVLATALIALKKANMILPEGRVLVQYKKQYDFLNDLYLSGSTGYIPMVKSVILGGGKSSKKKSHTYESRTMAELKEVAKKRKIKVTGLNKAELIVKLRGK